MLLRFFGVPRSGVVPPPTTDTSYVTIVFAPLTGDGEFIGSIDASAEFDLDITPADAIYVPALAASGEYIGGLASSAEFAGLVGDGSYLVELTGEGSP